MLEMKDIRLETHMWVIIWHKLHRLSSRSQSGRTFLGSREDILAVKFFEGFPKVKDYTSSKAFWLPLMLSYILNLSPFLEFFLFHF